MQSIALVAEERGLGSCFQEFWGTLRTTLKQHFQRGEQEMVYCGMALGYADKTAKVNSLRSERVPVEEFVRFQFDGGRGTPMPQRRLRDMNPKGRAAARREWVAMGAAMLAACDTAKRNATAHDGYG